SQLACAAPLSPGSHCPVHLVRWRRRDPQDLGALRPWIDVAVRDAALEHNAVSLLEEVAVRADPELQPPVQDDDALFIGIVCVGLLAGASARLDDAQDHLQFALQVRRQQVVAPLLAWVDELPALITPYHAVAM